MVVVVSGQSERLKAKSDETLEHLVHQALEKSDNHGQAPSEWELLTEVRREAVDDVRIAERVYDQADRARSRPTVRVRERTDRHPAS